MANRRLAVGLTAMILCVLAGAVGVAVGGEDVSAAHYITIPQLSTVPVIDGRLVAEYWAGLSTEEWGRAASTTGFIGGTTGMASRVQPMVYICCDESNIYVGFSSPILPGNKITATEVTKDSQVWQDDTVDVVLQPEAPSGVVYHFSGAAGGERRAYRDLADYECEFTFKSDIGKNAWTAEFVIPFAALGNAEPVTDDVWGVNFGRGFPGSPVKFCSWSPTRSIDDGAGLGRLRFGGGGPFVHVNVLGDIFSGKLNLLGGILAESGTFTFRSAAQVKPGGFEVENPLVIYEGIGAGPVKMEQKSLSIAGGYVEFVFIKTLEQKHSIVAWEIKDSGGQVLQRHAFDVNPLPLLKAKITSSPSQDKVTVNVDASGSYVPGEKLIATVSVVPKKDSAVVLKIEQELIEGRGAVELPYSKIPIGETTIAVTVASNGRETASENCSYSNMGPIPAAYKKLGYEPLVPAPWTPVEVNGNTVNVWGRSIVFGDNGLPTEIMSAGLSILRSPIRLRAYSNGVEVEPVCGPDVIRKLTDEVALCESMVEYSGLRVATNCRTEFDGCMRIELDVTAGENGPGNVDLEIPLAGDFALLMQAHEMGGFNSKSVPGGTGVIWSQRFMPVIWIGNTKAGLSWFADSQEGWRLPDGDKATQELVREGDEVILRIHLADGAFPAGASRRIVFGLQATPVKAVPKDWRRYRMCGVNPFLGDKYQDRFIPEVALEYWAWPMPMSDETAAKLGAEHYGWTTIQGEIDLVRSGNGRMTCYTCCQWVGASLPWYQTYNEDWYLTYGGIRTRGEKAWWLGMPVCPGSEWTDAWMGQVENVMVDYGFDGIYIDVFLPWKCANRNHGHGYIDDKGQLQGQYTVWAMREQMKRAYRVVHQRKNGYIMGHISSVYISPVHGFVDTAITGEQFWTEFHVNGETDYHDILPLDLCQVEVLGRQWGWASLWLPEFKKTSGPTSRQMVSLVLLHDSLVWPAYMAGGEYYLANAVLCNLGFIDSEYVGYFDVPAPAKADNPNILVSAYCRPNGDASKAILFVTNYSAAGGVFMVVPNRGTLGLPDGRLKAVEYNDSLTGEPLSCRDEGFQIEIGPKDFRIVSISVENGEQMETSNIGTQSE